MINYSGCEPAKVVQIVMIQIKHVGQIACTKCCQASQCADLTKSQCDTGWTWCGD